MLQFNVDKFGKSCLELVKQLSSADVEALNCNILICVFWTILKSYNEAAKHNKLVSDLCEQLCSIVQYEPNLSCGQFMF